MTFTIHLDKDYVIGKSDDDLTIVNNKIVPIDFESFHMMISKTALLSSVLSSDVFISVAELCDLTDETLMMCFFNVAVCGNYKALRYLKRNCQYDQKIILGLLTETLRELLMDSEKYHEQICDIVTAVKYLTGISLGEYPEDVAETIRRI